MNKSQSPWVVIHMAHGEERARLSREALEREGFLVKTRSVARSISSGDSFIEVLVLSSEAQEARDLLSELPV